MAAELGFWLSGCSPVLADQASDGVPALDPGSDIDGLAGFVQWRSLLPPDGAGGHCNVARTRPGRSGDAARRRSARDRDTRGAACPHTVPRKNLPAVIGPGP